MSVVILCSAVVLCEDALGCLTDLDYVLVVILVNVIDIDGCYVRQSVVDSDLAVIRFVRS